MQITIPRGGRSEPVRIDIMTPRGGFIVSADGKQSVAEFALPPDVQEDELRIAVRFCGSNGKPFPGEAAVLLQEPKPKAIMPVPVPVPVPAAIKPKPLAIKPKAEEPKVQEPKQPLSK